MGRTQGRFTNTFPTSGTALADTQTRTCTAAAGPCVCVCVFVYIGLLFSAKGHFIMPS